VGVKVRKIRGAWWVVVHHAGKRWKQRIGPRKERADAVADNLAAKLKTGEITGRPADEKPVPFDEFARRWLRTEIEIPMERGLDDAVAPGTVGVYRLQVEKHLIQGLESTDMRAIDTRKVQELQERFMEIGCPRSAQSINMALSCLRQILSHARRKGLVSINAVEEWKRHQRKRRRSMKGAEQATRQRVLSAEDLARVLEAFRTDAPRFHGLVLFLADTGCRFGEVVALRWADLDLDGGTARICRSFSSGERLGLTKSGKERTVELSSRLRDVLRSRRPEILSQDALVFPNKSGGFFLDVNFRTKVWHPLIARTLGGGRHVRPHDLRHTWASLHLARSTPIKWVQAQGGWSTARMLLDIYGHVIPDRTRGFADVLATAENAPPAAPRSVAALAGAESASKGAASAPGYAELPQGIGPRSPIMHLTLPPPFLRNSETSTVTGRTPRSRT